MNRNELIEKVKELEKKIPAYRDQLLSYVVEYIHEDGWGHQFTISSICDLEFNEYETINVQFHDFFYVYCQDDFKPVQDLIEVLKEYFTMRCEDEGYKYEIKSSLYRWVTYTFTKNNPSLAIINKLGGQDE